MLLVIGSNKISNMMEKSKVFNEEYCQMDNFYKIRQKSPLKVTTLNSNRSILSENQANLVSLSHTISLNKQKIH